ncbi:MAG: hypothetical protein V1893_01030 [Candidatus Omnitrophota bacterium]
MDKKQKLLGEILLHKGLLKPEQIEEALKIQQKTKEFLGAILIKKNYIKEKDLLGALSEQFSIPLVSLKNKYIHWNLVKQFSPSFILDYKCFPVKKDEWSITMAITNPLDAWVLKKAEEAAGGGTKIQFVLVSHADMEEVIERYKEHIRGDLFKMFK